MSSVLTFGQALEKPQGDKGQLTSPQDHCEEKRGGPGRLTQFWAGSCGLSLGLSRKSQGRVSALWGGTWELWDLLPEGPGRPDIPKLSGGGWQMCLSQGALLPTLHDYPQGGITKWFLQLILRYSR